MYAAAEVAGLRSAILPQQGLTHTEISIVAAADLMYTKYSQTQLDTIAANGTFIITQENEDGARFIRHQLTTKTGSGSLYYEDSVGVNIDSISFQLKALLKPYIGRTNVNAKTIRDIYNDVFKALADFATDPGFGQSIGPALNGFTDLIVAVDDNFKDRINITAALQVPLPLNVIDTTLRASASLDQGELSLESFNISSVGTDPSTLALALFDNQGNVVQVGYELPTNLADN
jgi:hypothetical protein